MASRKHVGQIQSRPTPGGGEEMCGNSLHQQARSPIFGPQVKAAPQFEQLFSAAVVKVGVVAFIGRPAQTWLTDS